MPLPDTRDMRAALQELARRGLVLTQPSRNHEAELPRKNYCPQDPMPKQEEFLMLTCLEAMYGGAAGGGKSSTLLMAALQYVHVRGYRALILRRTFADLSLPDAIMDRAKKWIIGIYKDVKWSETLKQFTFPSGATLTFGYMENEADKYHYQGAAFQFIGFDELTQFTETMYTYMFSRLRRLKGSRVPLRMRSASNPGGIGHDWVKLRFITAPNSGKRPRVFIQSLLKDNPYLDIEEYMDSLGELDPVTKEQLLNGDWDVLPPGDLYKREYFLDKCLFRMPKEDGPDFLCRAWDTAATVPHPGNTDPDWTVGLLLGVCKATKIFYILDVVRFQKGPGDVEKAILRQAELDGKEVVQVIAEEPGSSGKIASAAIIKSLVGYPCEARKETGHKFIRAKAPAGQAQKGNIYYMEGAWNLEFFKEIIAFTMDTKLHDDQVDALSLAFAFLAELVKPSVTSVNVRKGDFDEIMQAGPTPKDGLKGFDVIPHGPFIVIRPSRTQKTETMWDRLMR